MGDQRKNAGPGPQITVLGGGEDVQGELTAQGNLELVHVGEPGTQHRRDEGVGPQEQERVVGIVDVIVRRVVITVDPHSGACESLKLNLTPHEPFRVPAGEQRGQGGSAVSTTPK